MNLIYKNEKTLFALAAVLSALFWIVLTLSTFGVIWVFLLFGYLFFLFFFDASLFLCFRSQT